MLASIHPLGERARDRRWSVTVSAYVMGSTLAATLLGAALGGLGAVLPLTPRVVAIAVVTLCASALAFDLHLGGLTLPTIHRQVDKDWLDRYRGWVVGVGFGFQLGLGVVTIVTTAAVYLTLALAVLTGSPSQGAIVGATFGLVRALVILAVANVRRPDQLRTALRRIQSFRPVFDRLGITVQALAMITALVRSS